MKILGRHGQLDEPVEPPPLPRIVRRHIELEDNERISILITNKATGDEETIMSFFVPGVLKFEWERGAKLDRYD